MSYIESADKQLDKALKIQQQTNVTIDRALNIIRDTEGIAEQTQNTLVQDREILTSATDELDQVEIQIRDARTEIKSIFKQMLRDKCFILLMILIIISIIIIIIVAVVKSIHKN